MWRTGLILGIALGYISGQPEGKKAISTLIKGTNGLANSIIEKGLKSLKENFPNTAKEIKEDEEVKNNVQ